MIFESRSPTRVDLAGGTLDLWPLYMFVGGACTINLAIDIWTHVRLEPLKSKEVLIHSLDLNYEKKFKNFKEFVDCPDRQLLLVQKVFKFFEISSGFHLQTRSESPVGGGLGGSSSLTISLLKVIRKWKKIKWSVAQLVMVASNLEAEILNTPTGTQDYFPAISGGLQCLQYSATGVVARSIPFSRKVLQEKMLVVYTGQAHHSGINNFEVLKNAVARKPQTLGALNQLKEISDQVYRAVKQKKYSLLPALFEQEYKARVELEPSFGAPVIEKLRGLALRAGAEAVKICGAGGGGCTLIWVQPSQRESVVQACQKEGFQVLNAHPQPRLRRPDL